MWQLFNKDFITYRISNEESIKPCFCPVISSLYVISVYIILGNCVWFCYCCIVLIFDMHYTLRNITIPRRVFFFVYYRHAVGGGGRGCRTCDATDWSHAGCSRPDTAVMWICVIRYGCPSDSRRVTSANRWRCRRLLMGLQCS